MYYIFFGIAACCFLFNICFLCSCLFLSSCCACSLFGFFTVWSTEIIVQHASVAALSTFCFNIVGSHTKFKYVSTIPPSKQFTPKLFPSSPISCFCLSLFITSTASSPLFCAKVLGMTSNALANPNTTSCSFPEIFIPTCLTCLLSSISIAPPPGTIETAFVALLTTITASLIERSASSMNCSAPPLRTIVTVFVVGHPLKILYLSAPTCFSSN